METALRLALEHHEFELHYQPQVNLRSGQIRGVEALIRWHHPDLGMISPVRFIPLAEETGLILPIGEWVLRTACAQAKAWHAAGHPDLTMAVNLSAWQFRQQDLAGLVRRVLAETGLAAEHLELELTESLLMEDGGPVVEALRGLKAVGVTLSMDDFGAGYSSLSYLRRFPIDVVKIDRSFIREVTTDAGDASITRAIIAMAESLGIRTIAEGVETQGQLGFLSATRCDAIQGYFFSRPLPAKDIEALLQEGRRIPENLLRKPKRERTLLLVDDEENILAAMKRLLRRSGCRILIAGSGQEGLELLAQHDVDVIVSDQRMPGMTGVDFLRRVKTMYPDTVRVVLSGYTELQSITDAINEGAIYKFLTKPWNDQQLRDNIEEAFLRKEMADENMRLNRKVQHTNQELAAVNERLQELLAQQQEQIVRDGTSLDVVRETLQHVPAPVIGLDLDGTVVYVNTEAETLFHGSRMTLGVDAAEALPAVLSAICAAGDGQQHTVQLDGRPFRAISRTMGERSRSRGRLLMLMPS